MTQSVVASIQCKELELGIMRDINPAHNFLLSAFEDVLNPIEWKSFPTIYIGDVDAVELMVCRPILSSFPAVRGVTFYCCRQTDVVWYGKVMLTG